MFFVLKSETDEMGIGEEERYERRYSIHTLTMVLRTFTAYLRYHTQTFLCFSLLRLPLNTTYTVSRTNLFSRSKFNNAHFTKRKHLELENRGMSMIMIYVMDQSIMVWDMEPT
jgi:hypothetical protein